MTTRTRSPQYPRNDHFIVMISSWVGWVGTLTTRTWICTSRSTVVAYYGNKGGKGGSFVEPRFYPMAQKCACSRMCYHPSKTRIKRAERLDGRPRTMCVPGILFASRFDLDGVTSDVVRTIQKRDDSHHEIKFSFTHLDTAKPMNQVAKIVFNRR